MLRPPIPNAYLRPCDGKPVIYPRRVNDASFDVDRHDRRPLSKHGASTGDTGSTDANKRHMPELFSLPKFISRARPVILKPCIVEAKRARLGRHALFGLLSAVD